MHRAERGEPCGALLLGYDETPFRYQVTELPRVKAYVTEHQVHRLTGSVRNQNTKAKINNKGG